MDKRVLLVEDDLVLRDILQDILEDEGYEVVPASDGRQALEYLRITSSAAERPALLILDLMMPLVTGWQVLETIRSSPALSGLPVIVMTAVGRDKPAKASVVLTKPVNVSALCDTVRAYLQPRSFRADPR